MTHFGLRRHRIGDIKACGVAQAYSHKETYIRMASSRQEKVLDLKPNLKAIARRIREIRGFDLTQSEFAKILGISQAQLSKYEKAQSVPTVELLFKLRKFSGKSIDWIVAGEI